MQKRQPTARPTTVLLAIIAFIIKIARKMSSNRKGRQPSPYNYSKRIYEATQVDRIIEESVRLSRAEEDIARESIMRRSRIEREMAALEAERIRAEVQAELQAEELLRRQKEQAELE